MTYEEIPWWPGAFHVYKGTKRLGIVNQRIVKTKHGGKRNLWFAHDANFFTVGKNYPNRRAASLALPEKIKRRSSDEIAGLA